MDTLQSGPLISPVTPVWSHPVSGWCFISTHLSVCFSVQDEWKHDSSADGLGAHLCVELFGSRAHGHYAEGMRSILEIYEWLIFNTIWHNMHISVFNNISNVHQYCTFVDISADPDFRYKPYRECNSAWKLTGEKYGLYCDTMSLFKYGMLQLCCAVFIGREAQQLWFSSEKSEHKEAGPILCWMLLCHWGPNKITAIRSSVSPNVIFLYACMKISFIWFLKQIKICK